MVQREDGKVYTVAITFGDGGSQITVYGPMERSELRGFFPGAPDPEPCATVADALTEGEAMLRMLDEMGNAEGWG